MALARKGSRLITVDGVVYRWRVRRRPTYAQGNGWTSMTFAVEHANQPGRVLVVSLPCAHSGNWMLLPSTPIRPQLVAAVIRIAVDHGWIPTASGPAFLLALSEEALFDA